MFALYILGTLLEPAIGTVRFVGIYAVSILGGVVRAWCIDPNELTVGASGGIFGLMAAAFLIARNRGLDELASQIGFFVDPQPGLHLQRPATSASARHIGGLIGGGLAALLVDAARAPSGSPNAKAIEIAAPGRHRAWSRSPGR